MHLREIPTRACRNRRIPDLSIVVHGEEENCRRYTCLPDLLCDLNPVQVGKAYIQQNQVRAQFTGLLKSFKAVHCFMDLKVIVQRER